MSKLKRLVYLDLLRGYLLFAIIIDHLQRRPNIFEMFTGRGLQWASAAEGFFFISGLMLGYVRGYGLITRGTRYVLQKILVRTVQLYFISTLLILLFIWWAIQLGGNAGLNNSPQTMEFTWNTVRDVFSFKLLYGWTDFLLFYVVFLLESIPVLFLLRKKLWWVALIVSVGVYMVGGNSWYWNWQMLFLVGTIIGYYYTPITEFLHAKFPVKTRNITFGVLFAISVITYSLSLFYNSNPGDVVRQVGLFVTPHPLDHLLRDSIDYYKGVQSAWFDRQTLTWPRLSIFALWFTTLLIIFSRFEKVIVKYFGWILLRFGQASLLTFAIHGIVVFWLDYTWPVSSPSITLNALTSITVLISILFLVRLSQYLYKKIPFL